MASLSPLTQEVLDADDNPLANKYGEKMTRDIVQFVPLRQFKSKGGADFSLVSGQIYEWVEWGGVMCGALVVTFRKGIA